VQAKVSLRKSGGLKEEDKRHLYRKAERAIGDYKAN
jgi:hypothetical protein